MCLVQNKNSHKACPSKFELANMQDLDPKAKWENKTSVLGETPFFLSRCSLKTKKAWMVRPGAAREPAICQGETLEVAEHVAMPGTALHRWDQHLQVWHGQSIGKKQHLIGELVSMAFDIKSEVMDYI